MEELIEFLGEVYRGEQKENCHLEAFLLLKKFLKNEICDLFRSNLEEDFCKEDREEFMLNPNRITLIRRFCFTDGRLEFILNNIKYIDIIIDLFIEIIEENKKKKGEKK